VFHKTKRDILNGNILQQMLLFFFPVFLGYLLQQVYGVVDSIVLGRFVGKEGLAAVGGSATSIINVILNLVSGMSAAITVITAQNHGKGDAEKVSDSVRTGMFIAIVLGALITVVMAVLSPLLLKIMSVPEEIVRPSLIYMYLYFLSIVPYFVYQAGVSILRALGDSKSTVGFILLTAVVKIAADLILAGVFRLGVLGTSFATFRPHLT
jgi:Na+-driven multidrug efflux pump